MSKKKTATQTITELEDHIEALDNKWKRALADYQNLEKRTSNQQEQFVKLANVELIDKLLPLLDDLERAVEHVKDDGILMILKQFRGVLDSEGVKEIEAVDKAFDPELMDCVEMVEGKQNAVVGVTQKGYQLGGYVIRPVKVTVGTGTKSQTTKK